MTAPHALSHTRLGETDDVTAAAWAYCEHCDHTVHTDVTHHRGVHTFTCPDCGHHNEIQEN